MTLTHKLEDNSTYTKFLAIYTRSSNYELLSSECKGGFSLEWDYISKKLQQHSPSPIGQGEYLGTTLKTDGFLHEEIDFLYILEYQKPKEKQIRGIILLDRPDDASQLENFHNWFSKLIVKDSRIQLSWYPIVSDEKAQLASQIGDFFAKELKNTTFHDEWDQRGRSYFIERVRYFTQRNLTVEAVLPAFPCKSSNLDKVAGVIPDKGEELALRRIIKFIQGVETIYKPGLKVFIVSDGHVFSDCIGVDDDLVDSYTERLKALYNNLATSMDIQSDTIGFVSLQDLFFSDIISVPCLSGHVELPHYTGSNICENSELSRKILMVGCDTDAGQLRRDISLETHSRLYLYRGFSKFMSEDLKLNCHFKKLSSRAFKKTVSKVAFEMIKRNDAYSNLVELLFPFHLRLSIHAHVNCGPKFGIKIIDPETCRVIRALGSNEEPSFADLLHIPTPWHNVIVKIEGDGQLYMSKSKIVRDAIQSGHYCGEFITGNPQAGEGGYYMLKRN